MGLTPINLNYGADPSQILGKKLTDISTIQKSTDSDSFDYDVLAVISNSETADDFETKLLSLKKSIIDKTPTIAELLTLVIAIVDLASFKGFYSEEIANTVNEIYMIALNKNEVSETKISDAELNRVYIAVSNMKIKSKGIFDQEPMCNESVSFLRIKSTLNEGTVLSTPSQRIYSDSHITGTRVMGLVGYPEAIDNSNIERMISSETDEEFMNRLTSISAYFSANKMYLNDQMLSYLENVMNYVFDRLIANNTGLSLFKDIIETMIGICEAVSNEIPDSTDIAGRFKEYLTTMLNIVEERIDKNELDDSIEVNVDILTDMGLGFIYKYQDTMTEAQATEFLNEMAEVENSDHFMNSLNEVLEYFTNEKRRESMRNKKEELKERRLEHKEQLRERHRERKEQLKERKQDIRDNYAEKRMEEKEARKEQKREQLRRDLETMKYSLRTKTLTSETFRKAANGLKRIVAGLAVAGGLTLITASAGFGIFAGVMTVLAAGLGSKLIPSNDKRHCLMQIRAELDVIDDRIAEADSNGDLKNKARLMRMRNKMQEIYNRRETFMSRRDLV